MKTKIIITVILIFGLLIALALTSIGLMIILAETITLKYSGLFFIMAFLVSAFIFGFAMNKATTRIKRLWE